MEGLDLQATRLEASWNRWTLTRSRALWGTHTWETQNIPPPDSWVCVCVCVATLICEHTHVNAAYVNRHICLCRLFTPFLWLSNGNKWAVLTHRLTLQLTDCRLLLFAPSGNYNGSDTVTVALCELSGLYLSQCPLSSCKTSIMHIFVFVNEHVFSTAAAACWATAAALSGCGECLERGLINHARPFVQIIKVKTDATTGICATAGGQGLL